MTPRGGARPGAGRKSLATDEPTVKLDVRVPRSYKEYLLRLGKGVISTGLRVIIKEHMERSN